MTGGWRGCITIQDVQPMSGRRPCYEYGCQWPASPSQGKITGSAKLRQEHRRLGMHARHALPSAATARQLLNCMKQLLVLPVCVVSVPRQGRPMYRCACHRCVPTHLRQWSACPVELPLALCWPAHNVVLRKEIHEHRSDGPAISFSPSWWICP